MDVAFSELEHGDRNQGALTEAPRGQEEDFLAVGEIANELGELAGPIDEVVVVDDLAEDEGILRLLSHTLNSVTLNGVNSKNELRYLTLRQIE